MALIFPRWTNKIPALLVLGAPGAAVAVVGAIWYWFSPEYTDVGYQPDQPVAYSHELHAGRLGIDCRYCHNTVEFGAAAAIPPASTCMNCHKVVKTDSEKLQLVRDSHESGAPIEWVRVHMLPDYAFFNHSVHIASGVSCVSCHGRVDRMEVVKQEEPLSMGWCLDCHRNPGPNLRPKSEVTNLAWKASDSPDFDPHEALERFPTPPEHCSGCHR